MRRRSHAGDGFHRGIVAEKAYGVYCKVMSRADKEPSPSIEIREGTIDELEQFYNRLQQQYGIRLRGVNFLKSFWNRPVIYLAWDARLKIVVGAMVGLDEGQGKVRGVELRTDPVYALEQVGASLIRHAQSACKEIRLYAFLPASDQAQFTGERLGIKFDQLIRFYENLGFARESSGDSIMIWRQEPLADEVDLLEGLE